MKRICIFLTVLALLLCTCVTGFAHDVLDMTAVGSISITMHHNGEPVPGGQLTMFRVAEVQVIDGEYCYVLTGDFADADVSLDDIQSPNLALALTKYVQDNGLTAAPKDIDENAFVRFDSLELGLYLFIQYTPAEGYNATKPFLVSIPMNVDGKYIYDVDGSPKVEPITSDPEPSEPTGPTEPPQEKPDDPSLPQTGQLNWPVPALLAGGMLLFVVGWILYFSKKKERYES